jgi:hypothetical protein
MKPDLGKETLKGLVEVTTIHSSLLGICIKFVRRTACRATFSDAQTRKAVPY